EDPVVRARGPGAPERAALRAPDLPRDAGRPLLGRRGGPRAARPAGAARDGDGERRGPGGGLRVGRGRSVRRHRRPRAAGEARGRGGGGENGVGWVRGTAGSNLGATKTRECPPPGPGRGPWDFARRGVSSEGGPRTALLPPATSRHGGTSHDHRSSPVRGPA